SLSGTELTIELKQDFEFFRAKLREDASTAILAPLLQAHFGQPVRIRFPNDAETVGSGPTSLAESVYASAPVQSGESRSSESTVGRAKKINHIIALFEGSLVED
ncbi:hypothetical protein EBR96_06385, partial [bacterium]|nr:hypothetical protein [bacterium]